jgi:CysZ protein
LRKQAFQPTYRSMIKAAYRALSDLTSPGFHGVLWKAIGLSLLMFVGLFLAVQGLFWFLTLFPWPWVETLAAVGTGVAMLVAFFFLMAPVTAMFAGLYLDEVAAKVEARHYPEDPAGQPQPTLKSIVLAVQFGLFVLVVNILALPLVFTGIGAIALVVINAYLLSREYFEMAAMRFMAPADAKDLRKDNGLAVFAAGLIPAVMTLVPFVNLTVPIFSTSYFVHLFKQVQKSSA